MSDKTSHESDVSFIRALAELLRENDLTEVEVLREYGEDNTLNVRVSRQQHVVAAAPQMIAAPAAAAAAAPVAAAPVAAAAPAAQDLSKAVTSPMVGTAYLAPEPGASAFVSVGQTVSEGQTILIIEAMKTMNQIPAPRSGKIVRVLVEDGAPVEFGAPLVIIE